MEDLSKYYQIAVLIRKFLDETITSEEHRVLAAWLQESKTNQELFDELSEKENITREIATLREIEQRKPSSFEKISSSIAGQIAETPKVQRRPGRRLYLIAASILLLISITLLYITQRTPSGISGDEAISTRYKNDVPPGGNKATLTLANGSIIMLDSTTNGMLTSQGNTKIIKLASGRLAYEATGHNKHAEVLYNVVSTPRGGQYQVMLPDGSLVWLNAASSLRFPTAFSGRERIVELKGEAYFEITKNAATFFKVVVNNMEVAVLGTQFNINAYTDEVTVKTTLVEGAVKISAGSESSVLRPGQQVQLNTDGTITVMGNVNVEEEIAWKDGMFHFRSTDIHTIMRQISRWYDVTVSYEGEVPQRWITGEAPRTISLATLLRVLELNDVRFRIEGRKIIVMP
jgi:ferric-dicitrate binding protein FerR (iron transport regulator)